MSSTVQSWGGQQEWCRAHWVRVMVRSTAASMSPCAPLYMRAIKPAAGRAVRCRAGRKAHLRRATRLREPRRRASSVGREDVFGHLQFSKAAVSGKSYFVSSATKASSRCGSRGRDFALSLSGCADRQQPAGRCRGRAHQGGEIIRGVMAWIVQGRPPVVRGFQVFVERAADGGGGTRGGQALIHGHTVLCGAVETRHWSVGDRHRRISSSWVGGVFGTMGRGQTLEPQHFGTPRGATAAVPGGE